MKRRINEIFYSLQGEGYWTGVPMIFVRFSGCNLQCDFCDTEHETFTEMTDAEILAEISAFPIKRVCLTGGEPALQIDEDFINLLREKMYYIHIETNGTIELPYGIHWITMSPKSKDFVLEYVNELKIIYQGENVEHWIDNVDADWFYLQPCSCQNGTETAQYVIDNPDWRLSLQTHKYLDIQ